VNWRRVIPLLTTAALLLLPAGCRPREDKPLWQQLEEAQYDRYRPRLDHMVEKYGDRFEMDVYGAVTCTEPEYQDWQIRIDGDTDNFAVRLRRDDLEASLLELAQPIFGPCQVYVAGGLPSALGDEAEVQDFLTDGRVEYRVYVPYSDAYEAQGEAFTAALEDRGYALAGLEVLFFEERLYDQAGRGGPLPEGYRFRLTLGRDGPEWTENTALAHMAEKYGDRFQMDLDGTITCTDPEYQDWDLIVGHNTDPQEPDTDNFAIRLRREDLEGYMEDFATPILGPCKVFVTGGLASPLGVEAETEEFFTYSAYDPPRGVMLVDLCICLPDGPGCRERADALAGKLYTSRCYVRQVVLLFCGEDQYAQADRTLALGADVLEDTATGPEGYRLGLSHRFSHLEYTGYNYGSKREIYWVQAGRSAFGPLTGTTDGRPL